MSNPQTEVKGSIKKKEHFQGFSFSFFEKIEAGERGGKKTRMIRGGWRGWLRPIPHQEFESMTWHSAGDLFHHFTPFSLPPWFVRLHLFVQSIYQHLITMLSLCTECLISPFFVCSFQKLFACTSKSFTLPVCLTIQYFLSLHLICLWVLQKALLFFCTSYSPCCLTLDLFLSLHSSEVFIF